MEITLAQEKAFNALLYFAVRVKPFYLTQAIKLLYLADEKAMKDSGVPITWLTYKAWKSGPVAEDIFFKIKQANDLRAAGLTKSGIDQVALVTPKMGLANGITLNAIKDFDDSNFSDYEIDILQSVVDQYGKYSGEQLVGILHKQGSLWHKVVEKNNLQKQFDLKSNRSDFVVELTDLLDTDFKKAAFDVAYRSWLMQTNLVSW